MSLTIQCALLLELIAPHSVAAASRAKVPDVIDKQEPSQVASCGESVLGDPVIDKHDLSSAWSAESDGGKPVVEEAEVLDRIGLGDHCTEDDNILLMTMHTANSFNSWEVGQCQLWELLKG